MKNLSHPMTLCGTLLIAGTIFAQESLPPLRVGSTKTSPGAPAAVVGKDQRDHASYAIGLDIAKRFAAEGAEINPEMIMRGIKDGFAGSKPLFSEAQMGAAMQAFQQEMQARAAARMKQLAEKNKRDGAAFLAANKTKKNVKTLPSGLQIEVLKSGAGKIPKVTDNIKAHYHGTLIDGTVFDSSLEGEPLVIGVQEVIKGWTEALATMHVGDKWRLYVPAELAYGEEGYGPVPPNAVLIFDLELLDIPK